MYTDILIKLGLTKNEAKIYEALLKHGESSVAFISADTGINRRNVYDSLNRLVEKGLIFEIRKHNENLYQAVDPKKLMESVREKETALENVLPELEKLYTSKPHSESVFIYRGIEGWKNYMRDILRVGQDVYTVGAKGVWTDPRLKTFLESFVKEAAEKKIDFHMLVDGESKENARPILQTLESNSRYLPKGYETQATIDIFGDYIVFLALPGGEIDEKASVTVIMNKYLADAHRTWFQFMWESAGKARDKK